MPCWCSAESELGFDGPAPSATSLAVASCGSTPAEMGTEEEDIDDTGKAVSNWAPEMYGTYLSTSRSIRRPDGSIRYGDFDAGQCNEYHVNMHNRPKLIIEGL